MIFFSQNGKKPGDDFYYQNVDSKQQQQIRNMLKEERDKRNKREQQVFVYFLYFVFSASPLFLYEKTTQMKLFIYLI